VELHAVHHVTVLGLRESGRAAALLARRRLAVPVAAMDDEPEEHLDNLQLLRENGVELRCGGQAELPADTSVLVKSPGVPAEHCLVRAAAARNVPVWSEVELAARFLRGPIIGITGTNGKTTTTELIGAIMRDAGRTVTVAGNVGFALARVPDTAPAEGLVVVELSSFQLEHIDQFRATVGVLLNVSEDHLDRHGSMSGYAAAKLRLFENQDEACVAVLNADDELLRGARVPGRGRRAWFGTGPAGALSLAAGVEAGAVWVDPEEVGREGRRQHVCGVDELALKGVHNLSNCLAATLVAAAMEVPVASLTATLRTFRGVPHRLQVVATVEGVTYVNDSKATNVDATLKALTAYSTPVHLILGGSSKAAAFDGLAAAVEGRVAEVILIGAAALEIAAAFARRAGAPEARPPRLVRLDDLSGAVAHASSVARPGDVVLLSPACASFDHYRNFEQRGEHFIELVERLRKARGH